MLPSDPSSSLDQDSLPIVQHLEIKELPRENQVYLTEALIRNNDTSFGSQILQHEIYIPDEDDEDESSIKSSMTMTK
jgi:hypothetical protein